MKAICQSTTVGAIASQATITPRAEMTMNKRRRSRILPFALMTIVGTTAAVSAEGAKQPAYIDATVAAADHYKLLSEEGNVRVIQMTLPAGAQDNLHSHKHETVYFLSGGHANIHVGDQVVDATIPDGHVMHHGPWTHSVKNVGDAPIRAIILEQMGPASVAPMEGYKDATVAAAANYTLLSAEGSMRVIHMKLGPGQRDKMHSHYQETVYFISGGKVKIHVGDQVVDAEIPDGHVMHHGAWTHSVQNVGKKAIEAIIFEQVPAAPAMPAKKAQ